ncbi:MAG: hypothetical protein SFU98_19675 [Leptospiraceae bacterium]|nr:hypothetical protein [Leptospiraceae bacterium]
MYYLLSESFPKEFPYMNTASILICIIIYVILLLGVQEKLEITLMQTFLSEYLFNDPLSLKLAYKKFDVDNLIGNVFPDMVKISGQRSGKIFLRKKSGNFDAYTYSKDGLRKKIKSNSIPLSKELLKLLNQKINGVSINDIADEKNLIEDFSKLKSEFVLPFLFKERVYGFLAIPGTPDESTIGNLSILASKSAVAIYNDILSLQMSLHKKYKNEFEVANRIEEKIFKNKIQKFSGVEFKTVKEDQNILLEFFKNDEKDNYFVLLTLDSKNRYTGGLVLSHMLGKLFSQSLLKRKHSHKSLKDYIENSLKELDPSFDYEILIGNFLSNPEEVIFLQIGNNFKIKRKENEESLLSVGWKYSLELSTDELNIMYKNEVILLMRKV